MANRSYSAKMSGVPLKGIDVLANAVKVTLGPKGHP